MSARISVVVPVYNVAPYLQECLESLARQTMADLEVVMVDDGSTDASAEIAERFAAGDPRFRLVQQANAGLGAARNTGTAHAAGELLAFVDSDDVVPSHAYELLLDALDQTGSDFATGNVRRLTSLGTTRTGFLNRAFERTRLRTHITRFPPLLADRTAWNKLFRRSFWDRHELRFPTGVYYEDTPVTLPAHYLAKSVDVIRQPVYLWRTREGGDLSITQRRTELKTLRDRVAAVDHVSRFLEEQGLAISKAFYDRSVVGHDLRYFLDVLASADDEYRRLFVQLANEFVDRSDPWVLDQPLAIDRLKWQLVRRRALPELLEVLRFEDEELASTPPVREGKRWYGDYPYRRDERLAIPARVFRLDTELAPVFRLTGVRWEGGLLRIEGYAYITGLGAPRPGAQRVELVVRTGGWRRRRLSLATEPVHTPDVTAAAAQELAGLDWSGFVATLDPALLERRGRLPEGSWEIGAVIRSGEVTRTSWRPEAAPLRAEPQAALELEDGTRLRAGLTARGRLTLEVVRRRPVVSACSLDDGVLQLEGDPGPGAAAGAALAARRRTGAATVQYPLYVDRSRRPHSFVARLPLEGLLGEVEVADEASHADRLAEGVAWDLQLVANGTERRLELDPALPDATWAVDGREVSLRRARGDDALLAQGRAHPVADRIEWSPEGSLAAEGSFRAPAGAYELVLTEASRPEEHRFALEHDPRAGRFRAELEPASVPFLAGSRPLGEGLWLLSVAERGAPSDAAVQLRAERGLLRRLPLVAEVGCKRFHVGVDDDALVLAAERDLADGERGGLAQRRLQTEHYPAQRRRTLRDAVVYDSFGGREYSDSPRAIHEELVRREAPLEHLWVVHDGAAVPPGSVTPLRRGSREHYEALARARYVVANDSWPAWLERRPGQTFVQTWHGAPLKEQGLALAGRPKALRAYRRALGQTAANWQVVVSPGPFATPILERAFPIGGELIETGLPRTDLLLGAGREEAAASVRRRLGLEGKRVVLYAPTYRDQIERRAARRAHQLGDLPTYRGDLVRWAGYRLGPLPDLAALAAALGEDGVLLFRKHPLVADGLPADAAPFVRDVSAYPDAIELLLAVDVLVTDYWSAVYDFASLDRPLLFFTPDLEAYRDEIRGFAVDFEADAPGPLLRTTDELVDALRDPEAVAERFRPRREAFVAAYCPLADGRASARLVDGILTL